MKTKSRIIVGVSALAIYTSALGSIIDDKSQFVGDFTLIDFETLGDGTPIDRPISLSPDEYSDLGVSISLEFLPPFQGSRPLIASPVDAQLVAGLELAGSPLNFLGDGRVPGFIRADFSIPVNAVGWAVIDRPYLPVKLDAFDASNTLIGQVTFAGDFIDGTLPGSQFGADSDVNYGFFGLHTPTSDISYVVLSDGLTIFDDLHFGVIPEPTTVLLLILSLPVLMRAGRHRVRRNLRMTPIISVLIVAGVPSAGSGADISGKVTGYATPFDPAYLPDTEDNTPEVIDLEGVRVWLEGVTPEVSTYTLADGTYEFDNVPVSAPFTLVVKAELLGEWVNVQNGAGNDLVP